MSEVVSLEDRDGAVEATVEALRSSSIAVVPTDSVYALAADAFTPLATQRLFGAKRRGRGIPLTVLIRSPRQTTGLVEEIPEEAERLMASYWPGPLTLVFRATDGLGWDIGDTGGTVALRMPTEDFLLQVIAQIGPIATTGANRRGQPVATTLEEAHEQFSTSVAVLVDGGERTGATSTIVDVSRGHVEILREGAISSAEIRAVAAGEVGWGDRLDLDPAPDEAAPDGSPVPDPAPDAQAKVPPNPELLVDVDDDTASEHGPASGGRP